MRLTVHPPSPLRARLHQRFWQYTGGWAPNTSRKRTIFVDEAWAGHTCATLLLTRIVNPKNVSEMLGHSTIAITLDTCSHVLPNMRDQAAAMEEALSSSIAAVLLPKPSAWIPGAFCRS